MTEVSEADLATHLPGLYRLKAMVDATIVDAVGVFDGQKQWAHDGAFSAAAWISARTDTRRAHASATVTTARQTRHMPHAMTEARAGRLNADQLRLLANARGVSERTAIPDHAIRRYLCDAGISRVVTRGASLPLDVGAVSRTATPAQWRALITHTEHCEFPGCTAPWEWCQAHHLDHWTNTHRAPPSTTSPSAATATTTSSTDPAGP